MQRFKPDKFELGFTLLESIIILAIAGILAAIAAPSFLTWLNNAKVDQALIQLEGALLESQREAIRGSKNCTVSIPSGHHRTVSGSCLITGERVLKDVTLRRNGTGNITFNYTGNPGTGDGHTIVLSAPGAFTYQKCLVIQGGGIGLMRTGDYPSRDTGTSSTNCLTP